MKVTIPEAAKRLSITENAVRQRIKRGNLRRLKERGRVYVVLDQGDQTETSHDQDTTNKQDQKAINDLRELASTQSEEISRRAKQVDDKEREVERLWEQLRTTADEKKEQLADKDKEVDRLVDQLRVAADEKRELFEALKREQTLHQQAQRTLDAPEASWWQRLLGKS